MEERLERLSKQINGLDFFSPVGFDMETLEEKVDTLPLADGAPDAQNGPVEASDSSSSDSITGSMMNDISQFELQNLDQDSYPKKEPNSSVVPLDPEIEKLASLEEHVVAVDSSITDNLNANQFTERRLPNAVLPLLRYQQCESSESSPR